MDVADYNRRAWDAQVSQGNRWTVAVTTAEVQAARQGKWNVVLTPQQPVPNAWFPALKDLDVLCLASGGGQQAPILAAAGARVTVLDNSLRQLDQDRMVAEREQLEIVTVQGDMRDLSCFAAEAFDLVFNPCSVSFIPDVQPVFSESFRVLKPSGLLMSGFINPVRFLFDDAKLEAGEFVVRHSLPYSDETNLNAQEQEQLRAESEPFMFSHTLEELIAGQTRAGFVICDLLEDRWDDDPLCEYLPVYFATLARKEAPKH